MINTSNSRAAYTSQDAANACGNLYLLPIIAAARYRELRGDPSRDIKPMPRRVTTNAGLKVTALQEIEAGVFGFQKFVGSHAKV